MNGGVDAAGTDPGAGDGGVGDGSPLADFACNPGTAYPWVSDPIPPGANNVTLTGITGNGTGDVWTVGNPLYAAHRAASWSAITTTTGLTFGRAAYGPKQSQALVLASNLLGSAVLHLTTNSVASTDSVSLLAGVPPGIWVSAAAESLPYLVGTDQTFKSYGSGSWTDVVALSSTPGVLSGISGSGMGSTTAIWGVAAAANRIAAYTDTTKWVSASTNTNSFNAVWVSPNNGVVVVGKNGTIMNTPATLPIKTPVSMNSPVTVTLADVSGTADGKHLWAVGDSGTIVHWDAACPAWVQESVPSAKNLQALWVSDAEKTVWAVGASGTVLHRAIP